MMRSLLMRSVLMGALLALITVFPAPAIAVVEGYKYQFEDEQDTQRFNQLAEELRCPKCQNQNLADSNAPVASDMRDKVYELMQEGQDDQQIIDYLVARYGDFVHYKPPVRKETWLLWFGPALVLILGLLVLRQLRRGQSRKQVQPLSEEERQRLASLTSDSHSSSDHKA